MKAELVWLHTRVKISLWMSEHKVTSIMSVYWLAVKFKSLHALQKSIANVF